jgi:hypothetical protein
LDRFCSLEDPATPELLAAIAQTESAGNLLEPTYWRWRFSYNPFEIYQPASSAVGLFQTTDPAYTEVVRYCIREKEVTDIGCGVGPYIRVMPSHAVELASIYLDRNLAAVLTRTGIVSATPKQEEDLAVIVHLRGGGPATAYARRRFQQKADERCGDHLVSAYMSKTNTMQRRFQQLAANDSNGRSVLHTRFYGRSGLRPQQPNLPGQYNRQLKAVPLRSQLCLR